MATPREPAIVPVKTDSISYVASSAVFANPERGLYKWVNCNAGLTLTDLTSIVAQGISLVQCNFDLDSFIATPISQAKLDEFQGLMDMMRSAGVKTILRFRYSSTFTTADAPLPLVEQHIDQLKPYLENNQDVIAVVQAGLIGAWGEWAYSDNFGRADLAPGLTAQNWTDREAVLTKLLGALPPDRMVQLRTLGYKQRFFGMTPLASAEAYNGSARSRVGLHNDCFLTDWGDSGTYKDATDDYAYLEADSRHVPVGGETCAVFAPRSNCTVALQEMKRFHWSYLNVDYHLDVLAAFKAEGCYAEIEQRLGYRFVLQDAVLPQTAQAGGQLKLVANVKNDGWATPFNPREVSLVLRNETSGKLHVLTLDADPRQWLPGKVTAIDQTLTLPGDMEPGRYAMLLSLPDPLPSLRGRPDYAIRFANDGVWETLTGYNQLKHVISIGT